MSKKTITLIPAVILCLALLASAATADEKTKAQTTPATSSVNGITRAAVNAGVLSCSSRINQVANFLIADKQGAGAFIFLPPDNPDKQLISVSMEIPVKDSTAYASASFAPDPVNGCAGLYEAVVYWPQKCTQVAEKNFSSFKKGGALSQNIYVLDGGDSTKVFLMPTGTGCVSIKKEVIR